MITVFIKLFRDGECSVKGKKGFSSVFLYSTAVIGLLVIVGAIFPQQFGTVSGNISTWVSETFGWYYMLLYTAILGFCIFLLFSPIGKLKLGKPKINQNLKQFPGLLCYLVLVWVSV